jgi:hypothetical protein
LHYVRHTAYSSSAFRKIQQLAFKAKKPADKPGARLIAYFFFVTFGFGSGFSACGSKPI